MTRGSFLSLRPVLLLAVLFAAALLPARGADDPLRTDDVVLPAGYAIEPVLTGLTYASSMAFGGDGTLYVAEAGHSYGQYWAEARVWALRPGGRAGVIASGFRPPIMGLTFRDGRLYVAHRGTISVFEPGAVGRARPVRHIVTNLPVLPNGQHFNGPVAFGPDGKMYFPVGAVSNSGVPDASDAVYGWLLDFPWMRDAPARDVTLAAGPNYPSPDVLGPDPLKIVRGGAFLPFGTPGRAGQTIRAHPMPTGAVYRADPDGSGLEVYAWGIRSPVGFAWGPDGRLYLTDHGVDDKGARAAAEAPDALWAIRQNAWYGWPDYLAGTPVTDERFRPRFPLTRRPAPVLQNPPPVEQPVARFEPHASAMKFDWSRSERFGFTGEMFLAEFGDGAPVTTGLRPVPHKGFRVVRVDTKTGAVEPFLAMNNPGSEATRGPKRPIQVLFDASGENLYLLDFGVLTIRLSLARAGIDCPVQTGTVWRIRRQDAAAPVPGAPSARRVEGARLVSWHTARGALLFIRKEMRAAVDEARRAQAAGAFDLSRQQLREQARTRLGGAAALATLILQRIDDPKVLDDGTRLLLLRVRDWDETVEPLRLLPGDPRIAEVDRWLARTRFPETEALMKAYALPGR